MMIGNKAGTANVTRRFAVGAALALLAGCTVIPKPVAPPAPPPVEAQPDANVLPTDADRAHVQSLMVGVTEPGRMAGWVAPPATGIQGQPVDFNDVKI